MIYSLTDRIVFLDPDVQCSMSMVSFCREARVVILDGKIRLDRATESEVDQLRHFLKFFQSAVEYLIL